MPPDLKVKVLSGASKCAIIFKNFVIKIPYSCQSYYLGNGKYEIDPFYFAQNNSGWNYIETEEEIYSISVEEKLDFLFCKNMWIGNFHGKPIYIQERCIPFYAELGRPGFITNSFDKAKEANRTSDLDTKWLSLVYDCYGDEVAEKLINFIIENDIQDLSKDNLGVTKAGKPIIIDYASFRD